MKSSATIANPADPNHAQLDQTIEANLLAIGMEDPSDRRRVVALVRPQNRYAARFAAEKHAPLSSTARIGATAASAKSGARSSTALLNYFSNPEVS